MRPVLVALILGAAACHAGLEGNKTAETQPDASGGGGGGGGGGGDSAVSIDAAIDSPALPACANGRVVYLNFDGVTLTQGTSNATLNRASWMQMTTATAPPYHNGLATRSQDIQAIVTSVTTQLSNFPIQVVTTRPATGQYVMIVYGGTAAQVSSRFGGAVNQLDCGDVQRNDVAWIGDAVTPNVRIVNYTVGAIGFGIGLTATTNPTDCMCGWDNACIPTNNVACVLTDNIARDPAANQLCAGLTTQSETQAFSQAFCQ